MRTITLAALGAAALATVSVGAAAVAYADDAGFWHRGGPGRMGMMGPGAMGMGPGKLMKDFDTNGDGQLSKEEIDAGLAKRYGEANTDGADGVTIQEFEPWFWKQHREMMVRAFQFLDKDGDGKVTEAELKDVGDRMFERADRNGDGVVSKDDRPRREGREGRRDGPRGEHHGWGKHRARAIRLRRRPRTSRTTRACRPRRRRRTPRPRSESMS